MFHFTRSHVWLSATAVMPKNLKTIESDINGWNQTIPRLRDSHRRSQEIFREQKRSVSELSDTKCMCDPERTPFKKTFKEVWAFFGNVWKPIWHVFF